MVVIVDGERRFAVLGVYSVENHRVRSIRTTEAFPLLPLLYQYTRQCRSFIWRSRRELKHLRGDFLSQIFDTCQPRLFQISLKLGILARSAPTRPFIHLNLHRSPPHLRRDHCSCRLMIPNCILYGSEIATFLNIPDQLQVLCVMAYRMGGPARQFDVG